MFGDTSDAVGESVREYVEDHENERLVAAVEFFERAELRLGLADEIDAAGEAAAANESGFDADSDNEEPPAK